MSSLHFGDSEIVIAAFFCIYAVCKPGKLNQ